MLLLSLVPAPAGGIANKALHRTAIPLRYIAAGELGRWRAQPGGSLTTNTDTIP